MRNQKIITYYVKAGMEFIVNQGDAKIIAQLTGKATLDSVTRELIRDLTCGMVSFNLVTV